MRRVVFRTVTDSSDEDRVSWLREAREHARALLV